jgi:3-hydroxyisobutyrate dehydrogenase
VNVLNKDSKFGLIGFIGLGIMGQPMALNLLNAGMELIAWNRSADKCEVLRTAGAKITNASEEVFNEARVIILMLSDSAALDSVLGRETPNFKTYVSQRTIIHMGTTSPEYSRDLEADIRAAGGHYVEAPVSGSRKPAEAGQLVAMVAGEQSIVEAIRPIFLPMCHEMFFCGLVPNALLMKLSINLYLITQITGLAESVHFAERQGLDLQQFLAVLDAGPMASGISRMKAPKWLARDFSPQASIADALKNNRLIAETARTANLASPLLDVCHTLYGETLALGYAEADVTAVLRAIEARTESSLTSAAPICQKVEQSSSF